MRVGGGGLYNDLPVPPVVAFEEADGGCCCRLSLTALGALLLFGGAGAGGVLAAPAVRPAVTGDCFCPCWRWKYDVDVDDAFDPVGESGLVGDIGPPTRDCVGADARGGGGTPGFVLFVVFGGGGATALLALGGGGAAPVRRGGGAFDVVLPRDDVRGGGESADLTLDASGDAIDDGGGA